MVSANAGSGGEPRGQTTRTRRAVLRLSAASIATLGLTGCLGGEPEPTEDGDHSECPDGEASSVISFSVSHDSESGELTVTADSAGRPADGSDVYVHGEGLDEEGTWIELGGSADDNGMIVSGDALTVGADADYHVIVEEGQMLGCEDYILKEKRAGE